MPTYGPVCARYQIDGWGKSRSELGGGRYDRDMRSRAPLIALLFIVGMFVLPLAAHAAIPFFGPIVPDAANRCAPGWGMVITVINNIIQFLITIAIVFVAPIMIAWSGFLFVVNPVNAAGRNRRRRSCSTLSSASSSRLPAGSPSTRLWWCFIRVQRVQQNGGHGRISSARVVLLIAFRLPGV